MELPKSSVNICKYVNIPARLVFRNIFKGDFFICIDNIIIFFEREILF